MPVKKKKKKKRAEAKLSLGDIVMRERERGEAYQSGGGEPIDIPEAPCTSFILIFT